MIHYLYYLMFCWIFYETIEYLYWYMKDDYSDLKLHYQKCFFKELYGIEYDDFIKLIYYKNKNRKE